MPILLGAHILIAVACAVHALKTGRQMYWVFILFMFPGLGSVVYVIVEVLPGLALERWPDLPQTVFDPAARTGQAPAEARAFAQAVAERGAADA